MPTFSLRPINFCSFAIALLYPWILLKWTLAHDLLYCCFSKRGLPFRITCVGVLVQSCYCESAIRSLAFLVHLSLLLAVAQGFIDSEHSYGFGCLRCCNCNKHLAPALFCRSLSRNSAARQILSADLVYSIGKERKVFICVLISLRLLYAIYWCSAYRCYGNSPKYNCLIRRIALSASWISFELKAQPFCLFVNHGM